jgi:rhodanese-related sulfurtransferase|tara:strand:+ start:785 stop:1414 length:630 start_codon:yes stop_codon:yes gene_type:complete
MGLKFKVTISIMFLIIILSVVAGSLTTFTILKLQTPSQEDMVKDFYLTETAVHVSPHHIRKAMDKGDESFILVDLRSQEEYEEEHIVGAINIPAYKDRDYSDYGAVERIVNSFGELKAENPDKEIIVYCYSDPCMTGRKVGGILVEQEIYVKHLGIGWNEWRYFWTLWNHPHEWDITNVEDYVFSGKEPGTPKINFNSTSCSIEGALGC